MLSPRQFCCLLLCLNTDFSSCRFFSHWDYLPSFLPAIIRMSVWGQHLYFQPWLLAWVPGSHFHVDSQKPLAATLFESKPILLHPPFLNSLIWGKPLTSVEIDGLRGELKSFATFFLSICLCSLTFLLATNLQIMTWRLFIDYENLTFRLGLFLSRSYNLN